MKDKEKWEKLKPLIACDCEETPETTKINYIKIKLIEIKFTPDVLTTTGKE